MSLTFGTGMDSKWLVYGRIWFFCLTIIVVIGGCASNDSGTSDTHLLIEKDWLQDVLGDADRLDSAPGDGLGGIDSPNTVDGVIGDNIVSDMGNDGANTDGSGSTLNGTSIRFDPESTDYFDLPFPSDLRKRADGTLNFTEWPDLSGVSPFSLWFVAAEDLLDGWGLNSGVFLYGTGPIDEISLPAHRNDTLWKPGTAPPAVFLIDVDEKSPEIGRTWPLDIRYRELPGKYTPAWRISIVPPFGMPRRSATRYAVVITHKVKDGEGRALKRPQALDDLLAGKTLTTAVGQPVDPMPYLTAMERLRLLGASPQEIVFLDVFTTMDVSARLRKVASWAETLPTPKLADGGLEWLETHDDYVVLSGRHWAPIIQQGKLPFVDGGGEIVFGSDGNPEIQSEQWVRFNLAIPKGPMPPGGFPLAIYMHGSGGDWRQVLDRGPGPDPLPGSGPAAVLAQFGVASMGFDFPLHGDRSDPPDTSGLLLYNLLGNPRATVDNFIMAAVEQSLRLRMVAELEIDPDIGRGLLDPGNAADGLVRFRKDRIVAMGQSMGSTIGVPWATIDPNVAALMLSGSGGILIEIATSAVEPFPLAPTLALIMGYEPDEPLDRFDPALHALQHYWDLVDPVAHARHVFAETHSTIPPKSVYQSSGLEDGYFSTDARAALTAALGLDVLEPLLESQLSPFWELTGVSIITPPVGGNRLGGKITAVSAQFAPHAPGKGHYVSFEVADASSHYACFLRRAAIQSVPVVSALPVTVDGCVNTLR